MFIQIRLAKSELEAILADHFRQTISGLNELRAELPNDGRFPDQVTLTVTVKEEKK